MRALRARLRDDRGVVGGADILLFAIVGLAFTSLVILNVWFAVDTSFAVSAAAREGARTFVESPEGSAEPEAAMARVMSEYGLDNPANMTNSILIRGDGNFERCALVTSTAEYRINLLAVPFFGDFGSHTITAQHTEIIDPFRSGDFMGECGG